jgi:hypothetical protein
MCPIYYNMIYLIKILLNVSIFLTVPIGKQGENPLVASDGF